MIGAPMDQHLQPVDDEALGLPAPHFITAADLDRKSFPPLSFVVPGILVEGLTILAGKPKAGKSWLCLDLALAVAWGGVAFGGLSCPEGNVLYAALEDSPRRLQQRMRQISPDEQKPARLHFTTDLPLLKDGCIEQLEIWLNLVPSARLIILDTMGRLRGAGSRHDNPYQEDYQLLAGLQQWALKKKIAVLLVHHTRKMESEDPFDQVSGTQGLTGAADTILVLKKEASGSTLHGRGRDIEEFAHALTFDPVHCCWNILGDAAEVRRSAERQRILDVLAESAEPLGPKDIADETGMKMTNVKALASKMAKAGEIERVGHGKYRPPDLADTVPIEAESNRGDSQGDRKGNRATGAERQPGLSTPEDDYLGDPATLPANAPPKPLKANGTTASLKVTAKVTGPDVDDLAVGEGDQVTEVIGGTAP